MSPIPTLDYWEGMARHWADAFQRVEAERDRYREALERALYYVQHGYKAWMDTAPWRETIDDIREALEGGGTPTP